MVILYVSEVVAVAMAVLSVGPRMLVRVRKGARRNIVATVYAITIHFSINTVRRSDNLV